MENSDVPDQKPPRSKTRRISRSHGDTAKFSLFRALQTVLGTGILLATLFTLWTPSNLFSGQVFNTMLLALQTSEGIEVTPTPASSNNLPRVGIVVGHWKTQSGAVCADGLTEQQLNLRIGTLVMQYLTKQGYQVDLLEEFDERLVQYKALALVSIHTDTCEFIGDDATGFKVAPALSNSYPEKADQLTDCLVDQYASITGLKYQVNKVTEDMTSYHTFYEVNSITPVVVIDAGYLNLDRQFLTEQTDKVAAGIAEGILCYLNGNYGDEAQETPQP
jgi:N-acetylmuramoyl-L-alanine amidase